MIKFLKKRYLLIVHPLGASILSDKNIRKRTRMIKKNKTYCIIRIFHLYLPEIKKIIKESKEYSIITISGSLKGLARNAIRLGYLLM